MGSDRELTSLCQQRLGLAEEPEVKSDATSAKEVIYAMSLIRGTSSYDDEAWAEMSARPTCPPVLQVIVRGSSR